MINKKYILTSLCAFIATQSFAGETGFAAIPENIMATASNTTEGAIEVASDATEGAVSIAKAPFQEPNPAPAEQANPNSPAGCPCARKSTTPVAPLEESMNEEYVDMPAESMDEEGTESVE